MSSVFGKNGNEFLAQGRAVFFFPLSLSITCQSLRKSVSCLVGFHTLVLSLSDVCLLLNYLSLIHFNGADFLKTFGSATATTLPPPKKKARLNSEDVPICKNFRGTHFSKSWQFKTCCHEARAGLAITHDFESFPGSVLNEKQRIRHRDKTENAILLLSTGTEFEHNSRQM